MYFGMDEPSLDFLKTSKSASTWINISFSTLHMTGKIEKLYSLLEVNLFNY
ncbi:hypothetical protein HanXRQr2_Chr07g0295421 [Helianthus annuus]|uniref:Uncharacterized protein n=1 Tax=Helianthus annuus TaxID=4232 RepID=A0A251UDQ0_HELAN|nr:hypothetical protein HanXRQr2_Chr07g0295421 [Helianthus annuus]KAJ0904760.1 hypothetical protein HanPSC8_Chr07g0285991 [Helianthus annuus]